MAFELPDLPYAYDALEPHIDAETMRIHHDLHHGAYVTNANAALEGTELADASVESVLTNLDALPEDKQAAVQMLHDRGAFELRRSVEAVAEAMGVSRFTIYNYLNASDT
jgi:superoxide dismutase